MPELRVAGASIELDDAGFMRRPELWNDAVAEVLAAAAGIDPLTADHWKVVRYLRRHYLDFGLAPMIRKLCKETRLTLKEIYGLFPAGPAKGACKVAGLPNANGCV